MKKCYIKQVKKGDKTYFKGIIEYEEGKSFDFVIKPMFLSMKQYLFLLRLTDDEDK